MELTVLIDNNTIIDRYFIGEPGLSFMIESEDINLLFDTGYSDAFMQNASKMNIDLFNLDYIVLSHGHLDHTFGLEPLSRRYLECKFENHQLKPTSLIAHPSIFKQKYYQNIPIGINLSKEFLNSIFNINLVKKPYWISKRLVFLGEIPRRFDFESNNPLGTINNNETMIDDYLIDDSALAYISNNGLVIITGCSHAGICNIVEYAKTVTKINDVQTIIGGFHLLNPSVEQLEGTKNYISNLNLETLYPCHCTDLQSKIELAKVSNVKEVGVGLKLEF